MQFTPILCLNSPNFVNIENMLYKKNFHHYVSIYTISYRFVAHEILYRMVYNNMDFVAATRKY